MRGRSRSLVAALAAVVLLAGACTWSPFEPGPTSGEASPGATQVATPTAEDLAAALVGPDDLPGTWTVNVPPDAGTAISGVVTAEQQAMLPRFELCAEASEESRRAAETLRWQAFRQLDQTEVDPIDMATGDRRGHLVFVQEYLTAGDPADIEATFGNLRDGLTACQGPIPAGQEGPGSTTARSVPDVGDDRYGDLTTLEEAGGGAYWLLYNTLVRQGPVLMDLQVVDIVMGDGVDPVFTSADVDAFLTTAVERLPYSAP